MSGARDHTIYFNVLNKLLRDPTEALDASQLIRDVRYRTFRFSKDDTSLFSAVTKGINIKKAADCTGEYYALSPSLFTLDYKRGINAFVNQDLKPVLNAIELQILDRISFWDIIVMSSVVNSLVQELMVQLHHEFEKNQVEAMAVEHTRMLGVERQKFKQDFLFPYYIRPELLRLISNEVVQACDKQLQDGLIPHEYRQVVRSIKNATNFSNDKFNGADYLRKVNLLPLERTWARIIVGTLLAAAGLALAATALACAVMTYGASAPISIAGMTVAMELVMTGLAFAGVAGLALACTSTFFANSKHAESEVAVSAKLFHQYKMQMTGG